MLLLCWEQSCLPDRGQEGKSRLFLARQETVGHELKEKKQACSQCHGHNKGVLGWFITVNCCHGEKLFFSFNDCDGMLDDDVMR